MVNSAIAVVIMVVVSPRPEPDLAHALEQACSRAVEGRCELQDAATGGVPEAVAIVSLESEGARAVVQLGRSGESSESWLRRTLVFAVEDDPLERYRAIGLTIATLVGDSEIHPDAAQTREAGDAGDVAANTAPSPPSAPSSRLAAATGPWLSVAASLYTGPGLDSGPWRAGVDLRTSLRLWEPPLEPTLSVSRAVLLRDHRGFDASWTRLTSGLAVSWTHGSWDLAAGLRLEGVLEGLFARQREPSDRGSRWIGGVLFGADVLWPSRGRLAVYAHGDVLSLDGGTALTSGGVRLARSPGNTYSAGLGVLVRVR